MTGELNHKCIICGANYHYCNDCGNIKSFTPWRTICDTEKHYQIYMVLYEFHNKLLGKAEASEQFNNIGITVENISDLNKIIQNEIVNILKQDIATIKTDEKSIEKIK